MRVLLSLALLAISAPAAAQQAGQLIAAEPMVETPAGAQAWKIRYTTRDDRGAIRQVTGIVMAPREALPREPRPVIAWTHGTWGTAMECAPSLSPRFFAATPALAAVRKGYVVVAPDYPGLGNPGPHPYLVGTATARSVLDAVRAARAIAGAGGGSRYVVWGESQGGHAALWTGQLQRVEGAGLTLLGVAADAPPTNLAENLLRSSDANARAFFTSLVADSWSRYYQVPLKIGARRTPGLMQRLAGKCISVESKPKFTTLLGILALRSDLRRVNLASTPPWASFVAANSVTPISRVPVSIAQTRADPLVSPAVTRAFARRLCANRVRVQYIDLPGGDHPTTAKQSAARTIAWIDDLFAGRAAPNDCGRF